jgi:hypothetical protein
MDGWMVRWMEISRQAAEDESLSLAMCRAATAADRQSLAHWVDQEVGGTHIKRARDVHALSLFMVEAHRLLLLLLLLLDFGRR